MGTNHRYDVYSQKLASEATSRDRRPSPVSLPEELVRATGRRTDEKPGVPVRALVPIRVAYNDVVEIDAEVIAWTPGGAVLVRFTPPGERFAEHVWLWANAVRRKGYDGPTP
ncbi:hypothetical protein [Leifsonia shinshuensis]|uniref:Uncharacterized protein n=1 Tax=Leifsonia shinshuensis TaxID=150026 RepID=A0A7G6YA55_9MICO|nr:hypothetical protein [Leifsonia shinshuensis]QNE35370.1 hypothetical protein F1C12_09670 [Leifsonia shinshuensis]